MATRAERFKAEMERSGTKLTKQVRRPKANGSSGKPSLGRGASYALEPMATPGVPSRKSTRRSKNRQKSATTLTSREEREVSSPVRRHFAKK
jgi:hypothetical protein